jgi:hypothetical protein
VFFNFGLSLSPSIHAFFASSLKMKHTSKQMLRDVDTEQMLRDANAHRDTQQMLPDADAHRDQLEAINPSPTLSPHGLSILRLTESPERQLRPNKNRADYYLALQRGDLDEAERILLFQKSILKAEAEASILKAEASILNAEDAGQAPEQNLTEIASKSLLQDGGKFIYETVDSFTAIFISPVKLEDDAGQGDPRSEAAAKARTPPSLQSVFSAQSIEEITEMGPVAEPSVHNDFCDNFNLVPVRRDNEDTTVYIAM